MFTFQLQSSRKKSIIINKYRIYCTVSNYIQFPIWAYLKKYSNCHLPKFPGLFTELIWILSKLQCQSVYLTPEKNATRPGGFIWQFNRYITNWFSGTKGQIIFARSGGGKMRSVALKVKYRLHNNSYKVDEMQSNYANQR